MIRSNKAQRLEVEAMRKSVDKQLSHLKHSLHSRISDVYQTFDNKLQMLFEDSLVIKTI